MADEISRRRFVAARTAGMVASFAGCGSDGHAFAADVTNGSASTGDGWLASIE